MIFWKRVFWKEIFGLWKSPSKRSTCTPEQVLQKGILAFGKVFAYIEEKYSRAGFLEKVLLS